jgi:hypothetical protein
VIALALLLVADAHVEVKDNPPAFALEAGFLEAVPETPIVVVIDDAAPADVLALDVVRIGPLGKGRAKLTVNVVDYAKKTLTAVGPTVETRKVGKLFASVPQHMRVDLPTGSAVVQIRVDEPMGIKIGVEVPPSDEEVPLVPLEDEASPATTTKTTPATPATPTTPATTTAPATTTTTTPTTTPPESTTPTTTTTTTPARTTTTPAATATTTTKPASVPPPPKKLDEPPPYPRIAAEIRAGAAVVANGLTNPVAGGGIRVLIGPRAMNAALGFAVDADGQETTVANGTWNAATVRVRLEGLFGAEWLGVLGNPVDVAAGLGVRIVEHTVVGTGFKKTLLVLGGTARLAPETSFEAGPGKFAIAMPVDVSADLSPDVHNFAPFAVGLALGYRLEL